MGGVAEQTRRSKLGPNFLFQQVVGKSKVFLVNPLDQKVGTPMTRWPRACEEVGVAHIFRHPEFAEEVLSRWGHQGVTCEGCAEEGC